MKVVCVKKSTENMTVDTKETIPLCGLQVGSYYTKIDERDINGLLAYELAEFPPKNGRVQYFSSKLFAIPSDLDETTLVNEEWEEKYCEPVNEMS